MLALLIFVDGVGKVVGLFDQDVRKAELRGPGGGAESGGSGPDDGDSEGR